MSRSIALGASLSVVDVVRVARDRASVTLSEAARRRMHSAHAALRARAEAGERIYGWTLGVGSLDQARVCAQDNRAFQRNLLRSHAAGVGTPLEADIVRAIIAIRAHQLALGRSGVRPALVESLGALLHRGVVPVVPGVGSVGASDLAPLAHVGLVLLGEGYARVAGSAVLTGAEALERAGLPPFVFDGREALGLINGLAQSIASAGLGVVDAHALTESFECVVALGLVARQGTPSFLAASAAELKGHPGLADSAARIRALLGDQARRQGTQREPLASRTAAHVLGALRERVEALQRAVYRELNAATDNPTVFADGSFDNNLANSDGTELAQTVDGVCDALLAAAVASERRVSLLLAGGRAGLPDFLIHPDAPAGLHSGLMGAQITAAACVAEMRTWVGATGQSVPTVSNFEDYVSMSALAGRRLRRFVQLSRFVLAAEVLAVAQAVDLGSVSVPPPLLPAYQAIRSRVPTIVEDVPVGEALSNVDALLRQPLPTA